jgi:hypothetical protein
VAADAPDDVLRKQRLAAEPADVEMIEILGSSGYEILDAANDGGLHPPDVELFIAVRAAEIALLRRQKDQFQQPGARDQRIRYPALRAGRVQHLFHGYRSHWKVIARPAAIYAAAVVGHSLLGCSSSRRQLGFNGLGDFPASERDLACVRDLKVVLAQSRHVKISASCGGHVTSP